MAALPVIAITTGEPAGIGPELCLQLAAQRFPARLVLLADRELLAARAATVGWSGGLPDYMPDMSPAAGLEVLHSPLARSSQAGQLDPENAPYVLALLDRALAGCRNG